MNPPHPPAPAAEDPGGFIPLSRPLKRKIKDGMVALTMANWCFVLPRSHLLIDSNYYFNKLPVTRVSLAALAVNIMGLTAMIWLGIGLWRRCKSRILSLGLELLFLGLLVFPADYFRMQIFALRVGGFGGFLKNPVTMLALVALLALLAWKHRLVARSVAMAVSITFPLALFTMGKIALLCLNLIHLQTCAGAPLPPPRLPPRPAQPRVVWMIFDETDYRLAFENRPAGTALPEFDRLRQESLFANHAYPPGGSTIVSMPALIAGRRLSAVEHHGCDLALTLADTGATTDWGALPSVFSQARQLGVNTALVGWYHPYGRLLGGSLNYCSWYAMPEFDLARSTGFAGSILEQIAALGGHFRTRKLFIDVCQDSLRDAVAVAPNPAYGLVLLHLPPPHPPGVYLPARNEFTWMGVEVPAGYFNNLVLADHELGAVRRGMESSGQWDKSWLIISSDHWWRKSDRKPDLYDGIMDHRVPFLVKAPGPNEPIAYSHQFNTVLTHDLILAILGGQVTNQAGAAALLDRGQPDLPVFKPSE